MADGYQRGVMVHFSTSIDPRMFDEIAGLIHDLYCPKAEIAVRTLPFAGQRRRAEQEGILPVLVMFPIGTDYRVMYDCMDTLAREGYASSYSGSS